MPTRSPFRQVLQITQTVVMRARQVMRRVRQSLRSRIALAAEHRFLQQQFALCQAPNATWRRDMHATRLTLVWLSYWCDWQPALTIVQPATFRAGGVKDSACYGKRHPHRAARPFRRSSKRSSGGGLKSI